ncbi:MAG: hypothetical protein KDB27_16990, partial [Planctomycetales bacterium]|nr:hypothetical protein [Planctomycetales bacterium]
SVIRFDGGIGGLIGTFVTSGSGGIADPYGITFDFAGNLLVSSWGNDGVVKFDGVSGGFIGTFVAPDSGTVVFGPIDVAVGLDGHIYTSSFNTDSVVRFDGGTGDLIGTFIASGTGGIVDPYGLVFVPSITPSVAVAGRVFDDTNNNGLDVGDNGIQGITVTLTGNSADGPVNRSTTTLADGIYVFENILPGTYSITADQPYGYLDGKETAGNLGGDVDNSQDSKTISNIVIGNDGVDATGYNFANIRPSDLQGLVWQDFNNDGEVNFGEKAVDGVTLSISGTDDRGNGVSRSTVTDSDGVYMFVDLRPGNYTVSETQPVGLEDGLDVVGSLGGNNSVNDTISQIVIGVPGSVGENYNFGERPSAGSEVTAGQTATIGFWQNNNGQELIESLNGGSESTQLSSWLAATFTNMYGVDAGENDLTGMTNSQVADFYSELFQRKKKEAEQLGLGGPVKMDAQVMAVALATYVTSSNLANYAAADFGFWVTENGVGTSTFNVGNGGEAFDVADNSQMAVLDLLFVTNEKSFEGALYDLDADGDADDDWESLLRKLANDVYSAINETGGI